MNTGTQQHQTHVQSKTEPVVSSVVHLPQLFCIPVQVLSYREVSGGSHFAISCYLSTPTPAELAVRVESPGSVQSERPHALVTTERCKSEAPDPSTQGESHPESLENGTTSTRAADRA